MRTPFRFGITSLAILILATACGGPGAPAPEEGAPPGSGPVAASGLTLTPADFESLPGWTGFDARAALTAFRRSCATLANRDPNAPMAPRAAVWGTVAEWLPACAALPPDGADAALARAFFEGNFVPLHATSPEAGVERQTGMLTGYYEPELPVAASRTAEFTAPVLGRPSDLVRVDLAAFNPDLAGQQIVGKVENGALVPYDTRATIDETRAPALAWARPVDAFFLQVQGSGRLMFPDGVRKRAAFAAHNGHTYRSIGAVLIERGELTADNASKAGIEAWIAAHPADAQALFNENPRFVFFGLEDVADPNAGPRGAQGAPLTAMASMAVDPAFHAYGAPVWIEAALPRDASGADIPTSLLVIAQDTGGAITGPLRGDLFFGSGDLPGVLAGSTRADARWTVLAPTAAAARILGPQS